jgi:hypothetical protein
VLFEYLNNFYKENSIKSKLNILEKVGQALGTIGKPLMSGISWSQFCSY